MESNGSRLEVLEGGGTVLTKPLHPRPTLTLPPRNPGEAFLRSSDGASPSPMTFVSSLWAEQEPYDSNLFSQYLAGAMTSPTTLMGEGLGEAGVSIDSDHSRMAARNVGAKVVGGPESPGSTRSNTARFKAMMPSRLPISRSGMFTIPPGLSPTTLLDSPVLLRTGQAEPSPTTGTFPSYMQESGPTDAFEPYSLKERNSEQDGFFFKPQPKLARNPLPPLPSMGFFGISHQQALPQAQTQAQLQVSSGLSRAETSSVSESTSVLTSLPSFSTLVTPSQTQDPPESTMETAEPSEKVPPSQMQVPAYPGPVLVERPSEDGYNWRKYGQKQVKGSEYPRSYYKCTNPNCPVRKKVERSYDGQVTEIVYKGEHNHAKPQATRRGMNAAHNTDGAVREASQLMTLEGAETSNGAGKADADRISADFSSSRDQFIPFSGGLAGNSELSLASTSDDEGEDGEASKAEDGGEDESDSKRRRVEKATETLAGAPLRTIREPRVVVQTTSEVDILDDGYRWRKYGQKVVKGNPYPRSYYKCTNVGCSVRKHVERSSTDPKAVITTYEGKHNHDVPAARNSNHDTSGAATASVPPSSGSARLAILGANTLTRPSLSLQEQLMGRIDTDLSAQSAMSMMSSGLTGGRPPEGCDLIGQGFVLKPKEEPGDYLPFGSSLQPMFSSSSSYVV